MKINDSIVLVAPRTLESCGLIRLIGTLLPLVHMNQGLSILQIYRILLQESRSLKYRSQIYETAAHMLTCPPHPQFCIKSQEQTLTDRGVR